MAVKALVLTGYGINCDYELAFSLQKVGAEAKRIHVNELVERPKTLEEYDLLALPGGFSFGDDLGSGRVLGNKLRYRIKDAFKQFIDDKKLIIGICNGFQVLVKMGLLPIPDFQQRVTLFNNNSGKFEDRWVYLKFNPFSPCIFTKGLDYMYLPVRHGEGNFIPKNEEVLKMILEKNLYAAQYVNENGELAGYPWNPNGSVENIAGICDESGRVFGLMPHPEAFNHYTNAANWPRSPNREGMGLRIFKNAVEHISKSKK